MRYLLSLLLYFLDDRDSDDSNAVTGVLAAIFGLLFAILVIILILVIFCLIKKRYKCSCWYFIVTFKIIFYRRNTLCQDKPGHHANGMSSFTSYSEDENESLKSHEMEKLDTLSVPVDSSVQKETRESIVMSTSPIG